MLSMSKLQFALWHLNPENVTFPALVVRDDLVVGDLMRNGKLLKFEKVGVPYRFKPYGHTWGVLYNRCAFRKWAREHDFTIEGLPS